MTTYHYCVSYRSKLFGAPTIDDGFITGNQDLSDPAQQVKLRGQLAEYLGTPTGLVTIMSLTVVKQT
jgi:hypothetical protein